MNRYAAVVFGAPHACDIAGERFLGFQFLAQQMSVADGSIRIETPVVDLFTGYAPHLVAQLVTALRAFTQVATCHVILRGISVSANSLTIEIYGAGHGD